MEVEIKFEPSGRSGVIAVGTYLSDAARRFGIEIVDEFDGEGEYEADVVEIKKGTELLSEPTKIEIEHLTTQGRSKGKRLAGQARIEKSGELVVMVAKKKEAEIPEDESKARDFKKEFGELPLEKKVANLLEMEAVTLSETFSFVLNSPFKIFEKVMDVMAEFGLKLDDEAKKAKRPGEHKSEEDAESAQENPTETKDSQKKTGTRKSTAKPKSDNSEQDTEKEPEN